MRKAHGRMRPGYTNGEAKMPSGVQTEVKTYQMYINNEWVASRSAKTFPVYDPSTEETIAQVPDAGPDDVNRAVAAAEAEFDINDAATCFEYYGGLATKVVGYVNPVPDNAMSLSLKEPVGIAGQI